MHSIYSLLLTSIIIIGAGCAPTATQTNLSDESMDSANVENTEFLDAEADNSQAGDIPTYDSPPLEPEQPATQRVYIVRKGDTLWSIASDYYGDGQRWREILDANPTLQPTKMRVGQQIILP